MHTQENRMQLLAEETQYKFKEAFGDRADCFTICEIVEDPNHYAFRFRFIAYDYFCVQFGFDRGLTGCSLVFNDEYGASFPDKHYAYNEIEWDSYLKQIMTEIELRIPDKFLEARGWL